MIDYTEELKYNKQERDRIKAEINDLESRIIIESGRRNRFEVNSYRDRVNRLKMRLNEISLRIVDLEKMINNANLHLKAGLNAPPVKNGDVTITDTIVFDRGFSDIGGEVVQTVTRNIKRKIRYKNNEIVSVDETYDETVTTRKSGGGNIHYIEASLVD